MNLRDLQRLRDTPPQPSAFSAGLAQSAVAGAVAAHAARVRNLSLLAAGSVAAAAIVTFGVLNSYESDHSEDSIQPTIVVTDSVMPSDGAHDADTGDDASTKPDEQSPTASTSAPTVPAAPTTVPAPQTAQAPSALPPVSTGEDDGPGAPAVPQVPGSTEAPPPTGAGAPTKEPIGYPTEQPSGQPSGESTDQPTGKPTDQPTGKPTDQPTGKPTDQPTGDPTGKPTGQPTSEAPVPLCGQHQLEQRNESLVRDEAGRAVVSFELLNTADTACRLTGTMTAKLSIPGDQEALPSSQVDLVINGGGHATVTYRYHIPTNCTPVNAELIVHIGKYGPYRMTSYWLRCRAG